MALEAKLYQKLSQQLLMTPQLQQAIKLLQLGRLEYQEAIEKEMLENPLLEEVKESDEYTGIFETENFQELKDIVTDTSLTDAPEIKLESETTEHHENSLEAKCDWDDFTDTFTDYSGISSTKNYDSDERPSLESYLTKHQTLQEFLIDQIRLLCLSQIEKVLLIALVGNVNKRGYLCIELQEIANEFSVSLQEVEEVLSMLQSLEPAGIGARDLKECLNIQLERLGKTDSLESRIINVHLDKLEKRKYDTIAKAEKQEISDVIQAIKNIRKLEPNPGRQFIDEATGYVVPDVYVHKFGSEYKAVLNDEGLPRLRISPQYVKALERDRENQQNKTFLSEKIKSAAWLIKSIQQRQQTIYKVAESIIRFQKEFLDHGVEHLKPLILKEVAEDIGMHESTVSRVTTNKFIHTPQGVFELKYFFTSGIKTETGNDMSSSAIKEKIRQLISQESAQNPVSDQKIVELLKKDRIDIARRTVAKYRELLGIESSSKRKKMLYYGK
jgi:RNA polymerase sigma-54 factor